MTRTNKEVTVPANDDLQPPPSKEPASRRVSRPPTAALKIGPLPQLREALDRAQRDIAKFQRWRWQIPWLKLKDPERMKAYSRISARLGELEVLLPTVSSDQDVAAVLSVLSRIQRRLGRELAWDIAEQLQITLIRISPASRLSSLLEAERTLVREHSLHKDHQSPRSDALFPYGSELDWSRKFPVEELDRLCAEFKTGNGSKDVRELSIARLVLLYEARVDAWRHQRALTQLRANYLQAVACCLLVTLVAFGLCVGRDNTPIPMLLTAASTGALGSVLTGVFKLRDDMMNIRQLRSFSPVLLALPIVGAASAAILFVVLHAGLLSIGTLQPSELQWSHHALLGFLAGFSETFFLGVVKKLAGQSEAKPAQAPAPKAEPQTA